MAEPAAAFVRLEVDGGVGTIRLDRPPVNAMSFALLDQLRAIAIEASTRSDVRAVVLFGGDRAFAAGADITELAVTSAGEMATRSGQMQAAFTAVAQITKPVVAAVVGPALGGGCELALAADVRFCADDAVLGQPEILLGVLPGGGGTQRLARLVGPARAKELIFTGRRIRADEALAWGLVDRVMPAADVYPAAVAWAAALAKGPAVALAAAKRAIDVGGDLDMTAALEIERQAFADVFGTTDREIGMRSFLESGVGKASFTGK